MPWLADSDVGAAYGFARSIVGSRTEAELRRHALEALADLVPADVLTGRRARYAMPDDERGPTITAMFKDGPLAGRSIEVEVLEGRPPKTLDAPADDGSMCRYCLERWAQSGRSAVYEFLYRV
jgi:hypothetical protein